MTFFKALAGNITLGLALLANVSMAQIPSDAGFSSAVCITDKMSGFVGQDGEWQFYQAENRPLKFLVSRAEYTDKSQMPNCGPEELVTSGTAAAVKRSCYKITRTDQQKSKYDYGMCTEHWNTSGIFRVFCTDATPTVKFSPEGGFLVHYLSGNLGAKIQNGSLYAVGVGACSKIN